MRQFSSIDVLLRDGNMPLVALICACAINVVVMTVAPPPLKTLHTMPAGELVVEAAINEGCIASDCCAH